jgi:DNA-directed RNA polymerase specialized sigma subunit
MKDEEYLRIGNEAVVNNSNIEELEKEVVRLFFKAQRTQSDVIE